MAARSMTKRTLTLRRSVAVGLAIVSFLAASTEVWAVRTGSSFVTINAAEGLFASSLFFVLRAFFPSAKSVSIALAAFLVAMGFGLSALYSSSWIDRERDTLFVRWFVGDSVRTLDFLRAGAGVLGALIVDFAIVNRLRAPRRRRRSRSRG